MPSRRSQPSGSRKHPGEAPRQNGRNAAKRHRPPKAVTLRPFERSLPMALLRAREAVMNYFRTLHRHAGISEQQWRTLRALYDSPPVDVSTLAERTYLQMQSLSRILRNLHSRGLIERREHTGDQRRSFVTISNAGRKLIASEAPVSEQQYDAICERFGEPQLKQLYFLLAGLERALDGEHDQTPRPPTK